MTSVSGTADYPDLGTPWLEVQEDGLCLLLSEKTHSLSEVLLGGWRGLGWLPCGWPLVKTIPWDTGSWMPTPEVEGD